tara:strand:+ start:6307 stop:7509 length:1203 start_codon:yes stop_codon:yes gene_type:complete
MQGHLKYCKFLTAHFWGERLAQFSIIRIIGWVLVLLFFLGFTKDYFYEVGIRGHIKQSTYPENMTMMIREFGDSRGFQQVAEANVSAIKLAWISGSSCQIKQEQSYDYLQSRVAHAIEERLGQPTHGLTYFMFSNRLLETLASLNHLAKESPDVVVITLHPFHSFDSRVIFFRQYMMPAMLPELFPSLSSILFSKPKNWLRYGFSSIFTLIEDQRDYAYLYNKIPTKLSLIDSHTATKWSTRYQEEGEEWLSKYYNYSYMYLTDAYKDILGTDFIDEMASGEGVWNKALLGQIFRKADELNIPTLIYIAPLSPSARSSERNQQILLDRAITLKNYSKQLNETTKVRVVADVPLRVRDSLKYAQGKNGREDYIHLADGETEEQLSAYLASQILSMLLADKE